ncbi:MAG: NADP-dependent oxidoreductase, partial [Micrococcales bacterium]
VSNPKVGDRVYSRPTTGEGGALTARVSVRQSEVSLMPAGCTFEQAAAVPLVGLTAWQALVDLANLAPGQRVLIHGGAGGVGIIAVQLAKHLGAHVTATASAADLEFVSDLGADVVLDYRTQDFSALGRVFDLVLDSVGGETLLKSLEVLKPGGLAIGLTGPADAEFAKRLNANSVVSLLVKLLASKVTRKSAKLGVRYRFMFMQPNGSQLGQLTRLIEAGSIRSFVGRTYSFEHAPEALADLVQGKVRRGKSVVVLD